MPNALNLLAAFRRRRYSIHFVNLVAVVEGITEAHRRAGSAAEKTDAIPLELYQELENARAEIERLNDQVAELTRGAS